MSPPHHLSPHPSTLGTHTTRKRPVALPSRYPQLGDSGAGWGGDECIFLGVKGGRSEQFAELVQKQQWAFSWRQAQLQAWRARCLRLRWGAGRISGAIVGRSSV